VTKLICEGEENLIKNRFRAAKEKFTQLHEIASNSTQHSVYENSEQHLKFRWKLIASGKLGYIYCKLKRYNRGLEFHMEALKISQEIGHRRLEGLCLGNIGAHYGTIGQYDRAIESLLTALEITQQNATNGDTQIQGQSDCTMSRKGEADHLGNIGMACYQLEQYEQAFKYLKGAIKISRNTDDKQGEVKHIRCITFVYDQSTQKMIDKVTHASSSHKAFIVNYLLRDCTLSSIEILSKILDNCTITEALKKASFFPNEFNNFERVIYIKPKRITVYYNWKLAARIKNKSGRLPLFSAIEKGMKWLDKKPSCREHRGELAMILGANLAAVEETDYITGLRPFMLAAVGPDSDFEAVYNLLLEYPAAIKS